MQGAVHAAACNDGCFGLLSTDILLACAHLRAHHDSKSWIPNLHIIRSDRGSSTRMEHYFFPSLYPFFPVSRLPFLLLEDRCILVDPKFTDNIFHTVAPSALQQKDVPRKRSCREARDVDEITHYTPVGYAFEEVCTCDFLSHSKMVENQMEHGPYSLRRTWCRDLRMEQGDDPANKKGIKLCLGCVKHFLTKFEEARKNPDPAALTSFDKKSALLSIQ